MSVRSCVGLRQLGSCSALMKKGLDLEVVALEAFENKFNFKAIKGDQIGLSVHLQHQYIAESADGLLPNGTPIEIWIFS